MFELIARLQKKSEHERQAIAFWVAASVTGVIALGWFVSVMTLRSAPAANTAASDSSLPGTGQLQNIGTSAVNFYEQFKQNLDQVRSGLSGQTQTEGSVQPAPPGGSVTDTTSSNNEPPPARAPSQPIWEGNGGQ